MVSAFSFCLYGPENPRYYTTLLENLTLIASHFHDWNTFVYLGADVPQSYIDSLSTYPNVLVRYTGILGQENMIHRLFAIDEPNVDLMIVRDADSLIHWKDRWAIRQFVKQTECIAHTIRDKDVHGARIMGGLFGLRKSAGISMRKHFDDFKSQTDLMAGHTRGADQYFLREYIYPLVLPNLLVHRSKLAPEFPGETVVLFPFEWNELTYCGRVEEDFAYKQRSPHKISKK